MLSIRNILVEMISECSEGEPSKWIPELEEIVCEARQSLERLNRLSVALDSLSTELSETLCAVGRI